MRAWRNTVLRFGLVSVPVGIGVAVGRSSVQAHTYDADTRERVKQAWTSDGETLSRETVQLYDVDGEVLEGFVPPEDETPKDVQLEAWTDAAGISPLLYDASYVVLPTKGGRDLGAIAEVLRTNPRRVLAGTARFTDRRRSVILRWDETAASVVLVTLHFASRVRFADAREASSAIESPSDTGRAQASLLVETLPSSFAPLDVDPVESAVILAQYEHQGRTEDAESAIPRTAVDILETLRASMEDSADVEDDATANAEA